MTDTELELTTPPPVALTTRPRRPPVPMLPPAPQPPTEAPVGPAPPAAPGADTLALTPSEVQVSEQPAAPTETPPATTRRGEHQLRMPDISLPWESDMPGIRSSEIRSELARRERRAAKLLAKREQVLAAIADLEAALHALGEDPPARI